MGGTASMVFPLLENTCYGAVRIAFARGAGGACNLTRAARRLNDDVEVERWNLGFAGRHAFFVSVIGPKSTTTGTTSLYADACEYVAEFEVPMKDVVRVVVRWHMTDFAAVDERRFHDHARGPLEIPHREFVFDNVSCERHRTAPPIAEKQRADRDVGAWWFHHAASGERARKLAVAHGLKYFPWKGKELQRILRDYTFPQDFALVPTNFRMCLTTLGQQQPVTRPHGGKYRVFFLGDSQIRGLWRNFVSVMRNQPEVPGKMDAEGLFHRESAVNTASFVFDAFLRNFTATPEVAFDAVVLGFGTWPGRNFCRPNCTTVRWSLRQLATRFRAHAAYARHLVSLGKRVIWVGSPAWPSMIHAQVPTSNYRLGLFNAITGRMMREAGADVVDYFAVSYGIKHATSDGVHYSRTCVHYAMTDAIMNALCR
jgi:hypothetical protein